MDLKCNNREKDGKVHRNWSVTESYRQPPQHLPKTVLPVEVDLSRMELRRPRQWGACWLALQLWDMLRLDGFFTPDGRRPQTVLSPQASSGAAVFRAASFATRLPSQSPASSPRFALRLPTTTTGLSLYRWFPGARARRRGGRGILSWGIWLS